jgi:hypothetical protein
MIAEETVAVYPAEIHKPAVNVSDKTSRNREGIRARSTRNEERHGLSWKKGFFREEPSIQMAFEFFDIGFGFAQGFLRTKLGEILDKRSRSLEMIEVILIC